MIGVAVAHLYPDYGRLRVCCSIPILIEVKNQEYPIMAIGESTAENLLPGRTRLNITKNGQA